MCAFPQAETKLFYGWWIVAVCIVAALVGNALGLFGADVYLHATVKAKGWPTGVVSGAVTLFYVVSAILLIPVGTMIDRFGPRLIIAMGAIALSVGVIGVGHANELWQVYAFFLTMGLGWACLSTTAVATTLAPWFERYQGRAVSIASLGASVGGMIGVPVLLFGIGQIEFPATTTTVACAALVVLLPLACFVLKHRPEDIGSFPDGERSPAAVATTDTPGWTRAAALRTAKLRSVVVAFGIGMMVQVGFLTHQVMLISPSLGVSGTSVTVSVTAIAALMGRLLLARVADQVNQRTMAAAVLTLAACALTLLAALPVPAVLAGGSVLLGLTVGNVTTLSPIIVRREFGAASFGAIFGTASCGIQLATAFGPAFYGLLHDAFGDYRLPLLLAAGADVFAGAVVLWDGAWPRHRKHEQDRNPPAVD
jgi:MFS family permease